MDMYATLRRLLDNFKALERRVEALESSPKPSKRRSKPASDE